MTVVNSYDTNSGFVHLHVHTEYSLLDGAVRINQLVNRAKDYDMPAIAITDHGVLYGMIDFYRQAKENGIKPIIGCEVYLAPGSRFDKDTRERYHLVLLAMNNRGYHNLIKIVSRAWLEGFYYRPRVDKDLLYKYRKGLIALSACIQGELPQLLLKGEEKEAKKVITEYQAIFGQENYYLELQDHNLPEEKKVNSKLIELASVRNLPLLVTNDVHYLDKDDADLQDILLALQTGKTIYDDNRLSFSSDELYFKNREEMSRLFPDLNSAYQNTLEIAGRCQVELDFNSFYLPDYPEQKKGESAEELLREKCRQGLKERGLEDSKEARKRLEYELSIIEEMGYVSYFLIVWDFVKYAENNGIRVGPGRGSAAGSLVSYLLGITKINPLKYGLIFERFLNPERVTMPDIDIDFDENRDQIIEYVRERYGNEKVAQIGTFGTMAARGAVRDVGRVLDIPYNRVDRIAKMIPGSPGITLEEAVEKNDKLTRMCKENKEVAQLLNYARGVEGMPRHISTHAAGVIIGPEDLINIIPLQFQDDNIITQLPMDELEDLGLLKMDFLGLRNLTVIGKTLALIEKRFGRKLNIDNISLAEPEVYSMLGKGRTLGVFQMESYLFQDLNKKLQPERFSDIIALLALGRPGPLGSGLVDDYIKSRHGEKEPEYLHPSLEPILRETFGLILYQEQVMQIASELAGYSMGEADLLRRGMGKKKKKLITRERERFVSGAKENGIDGEIAHEIFDQMEYFAGYGFNKSHSAAYALLAYQTAYLKAKYPAEFMAALLSSVMNNLDKIGLYIRECKEMGVGVLPPDINESGYEFVTTSDGKIRFGLKAIKNVGKNAIEAIIEGRQVKPYNSLRDFIKRVDLTRVNIKVVESLIKSGALDSMRTYRSQMLIKFEELYEKINASQRGQKKGQRSFFDLFEEDNKFYSDRVEYPEIDELAFADKLAMEKEYLGIYLSGHPLDDNLNKIRCFTNVTSRDLKDIEREKNISIAGIVVNRKEHITKRNNQMAFLTIEDRVGKSEVIVFPDLYSNLDNSVEPGSLILVNGHITDDKSIIARSILSLNIAMLRIKLHQIPEEKLSDLKTVLTKNRGNIPVYFHINNKGESLNILAGKKYWISRNNDVEEKLKELAGEGCFKYY